MTASCPTCHGDRVVSRPCSRWSCLGGDLVGPEGKRRPCEDCGGAGEKTTECEDCKFTKDERPEGR